MTASAAPSAPNPRPLGVALVGLGFGEKVHLPALLEDPRVQALVIATPPEPRFALAQAAIAAGKHLLLEKPVALDAAQIEELQRQALAAGVTVAVDFEYRAVPAFQQLAGLLQQGAVGEPSTRVPSLPYTSIQ